jgi:hypothetical protein
VRCLSDRAQHSQARKAARVFGRPFHVRPQFGGKVPEYRATATKGWDRKRWVSDFADCSAPLLAQHGAVPIGRGNPGSGSLIPQLIHAENPPHCEKPAGMAPRSNARLGTRKSSRAGSGKCWPQ